MKGTLQSK